MTLCLYLALRKDNDFSVNIDKIKVMMFKILALRIRILGREKGSIPMILYISKHSSHRAMVLPMEAIDG